MSPMADSEQEIASPEVADLDSVISTSELSRRPTRPPDHEAENRAMVALVEAMTASPDDILQNLVETALELCRAHSAGISVPDGDRECFRWPAIAGQWASYVGDGTRRDFGPCSTVLNRNSPILFSRPERYFAYLAPVRPPVEEGLLIPFHVGGEPIGTIWVLAHDQTRKFDAEDLRVMTNLAHFAAAAYSARTRQAAVRADVSAALATAGSLRGMLQSCAEALVRHLDAAVARIWVIAKDSGALELQTTAGIDTRLEGVHGPVGHSHIGLIAHERKPHVTNDVKNDPRLNDQEWAPAEGMVAFAGYPLVVGSQAVGVLEMFSRKPMSHATIETLATIADTIAQAIQRAESEADLDRARSELARVARVTSLGALAASIAHEVNQPLSGIITNAGTCVRMLDADPPNVDGARETARRTIRDGNRASEVITRLRALFGKKDTSTESVNLNEAAREVIALSLGELQRNRVTLRAEFADELPPVTGDRVQLQQVILNLFLNAFDAMRGVEDRPRQLVIRTERDGGDRVRLSVQDAGVGLDPNSLDRLFEAFYTTKSGGMGIGLSVSRSIIESHHGRLRAAPNDGPGATFSFSIPCDPEATRGATGPDATSTPSAVLEHAPRHT